MSLQTSTSVLVTFVVGFLLCSFALPAQAQLLKPDASSGIKAQTGAVVNDTDPESAPDPRLIAFFIIQVFLSILGTFFFGLSLLSGYYYLTARGRDEQIKIAQDTMRRAIIGLIIIFGSFAIVRFSLLNIQGAINEGYDYYEERQYVNNETNDEGVRVLPQ